MLVVHKQTFMVIVTNSSSYYKRFYSFKVTNVSTNPNQPPWLSQLVFINYFNHLYHITQPTFSLVKINNAGCSLPNFMVV